MSYFGILKGYVKYKYHKYNIKKNTYQKVIINDDLHDDTYITTLNNLIHDNSDENEVIFKNVSLTEILKLEKVIGSNNNADAKIAGITPALFIFNGK